MKIYILNLLLFLSTWSTHIVAQKMVYTYNEAGLRVAHHILSSEPLIGVNSDSLILDVTAGNQSLEIVNKGSSDLVWTIQSNNIWLKITEGTFGTNKGTVKFDYEANTDKKRTGTFTITAPNATNSPYTYTVYQKGVNSAPIVINPIEDVNQTLGFNTIEIDISNVFYDPDGDELNYTITSSDTSLISTAISGNKIILKEKTKGAQRITISVTASDGELEATDSFIIDLSTSIFETKVDGISIYPNPTTGKVILDIQNDNLSDINVRVLNIAGQKVFENMYRQRNQIELDFSGNTAGIYLVNVIVGEEYFVKKIILQNK